MSILINSLIMEYESFMSMMHLEIILAGRILLAALCGFIVGFERKTHFKPAGIKTHMVVAFAAALMMGISQYGFNGAEKFDAARVAAQVVSGISFLGAGIIIKRHQNIEGLTTAATIWCMAGIGLAIGAGLYISGIFTTILLTLTTGFLHHFERKRKDSQGTYLIELSSMDEIQKINDNPNIQVLTFSTEKKGPDQYSIKIIASFKSIEERLAWEDSVLANHSVHKFEYLFSPE